MAAAFADVRSADMSSSFVSTSTSAGSPPLSSALPPPPPPPPPSSSLAWTSAEDATMRNALAFLAQKDSESALVYALVHDPEFRLATALTSNAQRIVDVGVVRALLQLFDAYEDQLRRFVALLLLRDMVDTLNWNELFRANSATTAIIREYTCDLGLEFLQAAFQDELAALWDLSEAYEVNPRLVTSPDALVQNRKSLEALATRLLTRIFDAASLFPYQIAKIYRVLEVEMTRLIDRDRKSNVSLQRLSARLSDDAVCSSETGDYRRSNTSLPRLSAISEDRFSSDEGRGSTASGHSKDSGSSSSSSSSHRLTATTTNSLSPAKEEFYVHLGGFLFLRFLCPALLLPHKMGLTPDGHAPSKPLQRTLVLVAKLFQSLANNVEYGAREEYMAPFNGFLTQHRASLFAFYDQICLQAQNDQRRESLILRSNLAPRISQLWANNPVNPVHPLTRASSVSSCASSAYGLLGNAPVVASADEALGVVQHWITTHLDSLVTEVATYGSKAKRKHAPSVSVDLRGSELAPLAGGGSMSPPPKKKKAVLPKHKLKSSKTLSPVPTLGALGVEEEGDEDGDEETKEDTSSGGGGAGGGGGGGEDAAQQKENVAMEDLERVLGQTIHRDIQLMKIYYASLSQAGLQRLLRIHSDDAAHEWTLHKSRHTVDVFRRDDPASHGCVLSTSASPFVEMKAHVEINATPRQVFKYLRSLEKMTEWDDRITAVRRVEPLDDSKVVLYRSHPKLSLWPTWLVKPRDSCDLHSFVGPSKTGRTDTYAVLLESVPRPDVPTVKGTVRMSFATGGFLVEPGAVSETFGQTTKLTCVVNADFKGTLPRVLAESICVRQVLSVRAVKLRLETALQHGQSTWV